MILSGCKEVIGTDERIKQVRKAAGLTQGEFAEQISLSRNYIAMIEIGQREPSERTIDDICRVFGVSKLWLKTGEGEMYVKRDLNQEIGMMVTALMKDADESFRKRFIAALLQVPPDGWNAIEEFVNKLSTAEKEPRSD